MDRMLSELSVEQFREWQAYEAVEPFGALRDEQRWARLCATVANAAMGRGSKIWHPSDFSTYLKADVRPVTDAEVADKANTFFMVMADKDEAKKALAFAARRGA